MPRGDRTGPWGAGPMTGRATGYCAGYAIPGYMNPGRRYGRGFGRGWGRGFSRGWGRVFGRGRYVHSPPAIIQPAYPKAFPQVTPQPTPEQEVAALENYHKDLVAEKADLEQEMDGVKARIQELKAKLAL